MHYLYKIENQLNNKCYVGFTSTTPTLRWYQHCANAYKKEKKSKLYSAMRKHGKDVFVVTEIYYGEDALQQEQNFIVSEKAEYNMTKGGDYNQLGRHWKLSEETKQKMRKPKAPRTKEHTENQRKTLLGKTPWNLGKYKENVTPHAIYMREYNKKRRSR